MLRPGSGRVRTCGFACAYAPPSIYLTRRPEAHWPAAARARARSRPSAGGRERARGGGESSPAPPPERAEALPGRAARRDGRHRARRRRACVRAERQRRPLDADADVEARPRPDGAPRVPKASPGSLRTRCRAGDGCTSDLHGASRARASPAAAVGDPR